MEMLKIEQVIVGEERRVLPGRKEPDTVNRPPASYPGETWQCFECFIVFTNSKSMERHVKHSHHELYKQLLQERNTLFTCFKCEKFFTTPEELTQHQIIHRTEGRPFHCSDCGMNLASFTELNKHKKYECRERRFSCKMCGAVFLRPGQLRTHRVSAHSKVSAVSADDVCQCSKCGSDFRSEEELLRHEEKYAGDPKCGVKKRLRQKYEEVDGKKIKQEDSDSPSEGCSSAELQIPCSEEGCDLIFPSVAALRLHKKEAHVLPASSGYCCPTCGKRFARVSALKSHQDTHNDEEEEEEEAEKR